MMVEALVTNDAEDPLREDEIDVAPVASDSEGEN